MAGAKGKSGSKNAGGSSKKGKKQGKGKDKSKEASAERKEPKQPVMPEKLSSRQHPYYLYGLPRKEMPEEEETPPQLPLHTTKWLEKNAGPKRRNLAKLIVKREPSRWAKPGPLSRRDWRRFYAWAAKNAVARPEYEPPVEEEIIEKKGPDDEEEDEVTPEMREEHIAKLATPRKPRQKHPVPVEEDFPYSPKIHYKKPARKDKGRPVILPEVPKQFYNNEAREIFWIDYRFPISRKAIKAKPKKRFILMAQPRVTPPEVPHCPIPEKPEEYVAPRRKMTSRQWKEHKRRLEYLAKPVYRPYCEMCYLFERSMDYYIC